MNKLLFAKKIVVGCAITITSLLVSGELTTAASFNESSRGDAGAIPDRALIVNTRPGGTPLTEIQGALVGSADLFEIYIPGRQFVATTRFETAYDNTQLFLFKKELDQNNNPIAIGLFANDNAPAANHSFNFSTIRIGAGVLTPGLYYLGISGYDLDPIGANGNFIFPNTRRALVSASNLSPLAGWSVRTSRASNRRLPYTISLIGAQFAAPNPPSGSTSGGSGGGIVGVPPVQPPAPSPSPSPSSSPVPSPSPSPSSSPVPSPSPTVLSGTDSPPDATPVSIPEPSMVLGLAAIALLQQPLWRRSRTNRSDDSAST